MPINKSLLIHKKILQNKSGAKGESFNEFIERFKESTSNAMFSNSLCYAIDLHATSYAYISEQCKVFTGLSNVDFLRKGLDILPEIMPDKDFIALSNDIFPAMQEAYLKVDVKHRKKVVFELYYHLLNKSTGLAIPVVEYSSYARFDDNDNPSVSTGVIYESATVMDGVRGIVRYTDKEDSYTIYDKTCLHAFAGLSKAEKKVLHHIGKGKDRAHIAQELNISIHTLKTHLKNIYKKLGINKESDLHLIMNGSPLQ